MQLQQILFFKELGFTLKQIGKVLGKSDFDQLSALYAHKKALGREWEKIACLLETIDKTIKHLKGKKKMLAREFFDGFCLVKKAGKEKPYYAAEETILQNLKQQPTQQLSESERLQIAKEANHILGKIADCLEKGLSISSKEVQQLIKKHCEFAGKFHETSKDVYKALAKLYSEHPEYRRQLDPIHPDLANFIAKAMTYFADNNL